MIILIAQQIALNIHYPSYLMLLFIQDQVVPKEPIGGVVSYDQNKTIKPSPIV